MQEREAAGVLRDTAAIRTPFYVVDETLLKKNLEILKDTAERAGCRILLAQKAFSMYSVYPLIRQYLSGTAASGLYEARLGKTEFGGETHVFSAAYRPDEFDEILNYADHIVFNTPGQVLKYGEKVKKAGKQAGLRLNPECSTQEGHAIYDPCAPGSRMGTTLSMLSEAGSFEETILPYLDGFHMHTLCEQNSDDLETTLRAAEENFGAWFSKVKWLNLGGGHHITREDYDRERLIRLVRGLREKYGVEVYLEPGEAVVLNAGFLVTSVLEKIREVRKEYPDVAVVCYVNSMAEIKAESDVCVTSSNALKIVKKLPNKDIFFIPDENLGRFVAKQVPEKHFIFNDGFCHVHKSIHAEDVKKAKELHPEAVVLAHPECTGDVLELADFVGSTSQIIDYATNSDEKVFLICTEMGVFYELLQKNPEKKFFSVGHRQFCPNMKKIHLDSVLRALENPEEEVEMDEAMRQRAVGPLARMLELAK